MSQRNLLTHLNLTRHGRPQGLHSPQGSQDTPVAPVEPVVEDSPAATDGTALGQRSGSTTSEEKPPDKVGRAGSTKIFYRLFGTAATKDRPRGSVEDLEQVPQVPPQGNRTHRRPGPGDPHPHQPEEKAATLVRRCASWTLAFVLQTSAEPDLDTSSSGQWHSLWCQLLHVYQTYGKGSSWLLPAWTKSTCLCWEQP